MSVTVTTTASSVTTPTLKTTAKRALFWVAALVFVLIIGLVTLALTGSTTEAERLSATSPAPNGAKALVEVLRDQGVTVTATTSLDDTAAAAASPDDTSVLLWDPEALLTTAQLEELGDLSGNVVLLEPAFTALQALAPGVAAAGEVTGDLPADCDLPAARAAGTVTGGGFGYRSITTPESSDAAAAVGTDVVTATCLGSGDDVYSLIQVETDGGTRTVLGTSTALTNEGIVEQGNAALALNLLGPLDTLVFYTPSLADVAGDGIPSLADLSPAWVVPVMSLVGLVALAAAFWRGRRLGPLVVENLPVVVRASETMEGRARLYESGSARLRALDSLRIGAVQRIAVLCALPRTATVDEVLAAAAAIMSGTTAWPVSRLRGVLLDTVPGSDTELVRLSDELLVLERDVATAVKPL